jgi:hypothetical protein
MEKKQLVVPVEVYSRVVGYFRPVNQWNKGKKEEFSERKTFKAEHFLVDSCCNEYQRDVR